MTENAPQPAETAYVRDAGYPEHYRDQRFRTRSGKRTHAREVNAIQRLLRTANVQGGQWLDVPSGAGRLSGLLPGEVTQVDRSFDMLAAAAPDGATRVCASVHALPFADDHFDGALCMRLIHHLPGTDERRHVLAELRRVTNGPIILSFFHRYCLQSARRGFKRLRGGGRSGRCAIPARQLLAELEDVGLRARQVRALNPLISEQWLVLAERVGDEQAGDGPVSGSERG